MTDGSDGAGLLHPQAAERRPEAVVVVVGPGEQPAESTRQKVATLASQAPSSLQLPNAYHTGKAHPVFAGLQRAASQLELRVLGTCMPGGPTAAPATPAALREHAVRAPGGRPVVVVACADSTEEEGALLEAAQAHLDGWTTRHMIVHACHGGAGALGGAGASAGRGLLQATTALLGAARSSIANRTKDYTYCDPICQKHVMWLEFFIVFSTLSSVVLLVYCCMNAIDVPTRFASADHRRQHGHAHHD